MSQPQDLETLDRLPALVDGLRAVLSAADALAESAYPGADAVAAELDVALEALDGAPGAMLFLAGLIHARGDAAAYGRWDAGIAARIAVGELG
jgi:hypothetical protein